MRCPGTWLRPTRAEFGVWRERHVEIPVPYDAAKDFAPVAFLVNLPQIVVVNPSLTPPEIVRKLNEAFNTDLKNPQVQQDLKAMGLLPRPMTPQGFADFLREEMARWPPIIA